jgi:hypothetical protein
MAWWASYLSLAPVWCGVEDIPHAGCASDWAWFSGNSLSIVGDSLGAAADCNINSTNGSLEPVGPSRRLRAEPGNKADRSLESDQPTHGPAEHRRLTDTWAANLPISRDRAVDLSSCLIHINNLISLATKLGYQTWGTVHGCKYGGPGAVPGMLCSSGVLTSSSFIPWLGQNMAMLIGACPVQTIPGAYCAADALDITAVIVSFSAFATTFTKDCGWVN